MATFNSTRKKYAKQWEDGKIWYNSVNTYTEDLLWSTDHAILGDNFRKIEFYTDKQKAYLSKQVTWAWTKCFISAKACEQIILNTDLKDCIEHYALITHDKDNAIPHTHMLIKFYRNERIQSRLVEYFHVDSVASCEHQAYVKFKYLTHDSENCRKENKFQYSEAEIVTDNLAFFKGLNDGNCDTTPMTIIEAILQGKTERFLVNTFGYKYVINKQRFWDCARTIASEEGMSLLHEFHVESISDDYVALYDNKTGFLYDVRKNYKKV